MRAFAFVVVIVALGLPLQGHAQSASDEVAREAVGADSETGYLGAKVALANQREAWLRAMLDEVRRLHAAGEASETDVAQVAARLAHARAEVARLRGALKRAEAEYESVVGQPPPGAGAEAPR